MLGTALDKVDERNKAYQLGVEINQPNQFLLPFPSAMREIISLLLPFSTPFFVSTQPSESVAGNTTKLVTLRIPSNVIFVWSKLIAQPSTSTMNLKISYPGLRRDFMRASIPSTIITGAGVRPYNLPCPTIFFPGADIGLEIANTGGTAITPNVTLVGQAIWINKLPERLKAKMLQEDIPLAYTYWYITDTFGITVTTTRTAYDMSIVREGDFIGEQFLVSYTSDFNLQCRDSNSRQIIDTGRASSIFGNGEYNPFLPYPLALHSGEHLTWDLWVDSATSTVYIVVAGIFIPAGLAGLYK